MKKLIALFLVLTLALGFAACGSKEEPAEEVVEEPAEEITLEELPEDFDIGDIFGGDAVVELPIITPDGQILDGETGYIIDQETGDLIDPETGEIMGNVNGETEPAPEAPVEATATQMVLQNIWGAYAEEEKFAIMGGNPEAGIMDAPGVYDMAYAENLSFNLLIPAEQMANVTEAATMIHMMNANNFTCGVVKLADGTDAAAFASAVRDAIQGNQWICGFPETLVIADMGEGMVLVSFGVNDAMTPFQANLTEAYAEAQILFNEAIEG